MEEKQSVTSVRCCLTLMYLRMRREEKDTNTEEEAVCVRVTLRRPLHEPVCGERDREREGKREREKERLDMRIQAAARIVFRNMNDRNDGTNAGKEKGTYARRR